MQRMMLRRLLPTNDGFVTFVKSISMDHSRILLTWRVEHIVMSLRHRLLTDYFNKKFIPADEKELYRFIVSVKTVCNVRGGYYFVNI